MSIKFPNRRRGLAAVSLVTAVGVTAFFGIGAATAQRSQQQNPPAQVQTSEYSEASAGHGYSNVVKQVIPAVVNIASTKVVKTTGFGNNEGVAPFFRQFFGGNLFPDVPQERRERSLGSGVIVSPQGYVLTNNHVVEGASEVTVTLSDNRTMKAHVVGTDAKTDIAVLKLQGSDFPTLTLGDSSKVHVGDVVLAVGEPFGLGQTVTQGIVSAKGRSGLGIEQVEDFIQTDAAINPGNSGGALVDDAGHLIGINTAIAGNSGGNEGIGFAVPVNMARHDMDEILAHGKVEHAYMGILPQDVTPALAQAFHSSESTGALVAEITPGSPAAHSDLQKGDIILRVNGAPIENASQLRLKIGMMEPNTKVNLDILRNGQPMTVSMVLGTYPSTEERASSSQSGAPESALQGVTVEKLTPDVAQQLQLAPQTQGVVVDKVNPASHAAAAGLQAGDVIQEVNHQKVTSEAQFEEAVNSTPQNSPVLLLVNHGGTTMYMAVQS
ncbi:MAG TPA: DegQ family serine endoprotease [Bryobacteraceae bacterium]|nr:DegQ family serine endoprotease [Bryobacteraceae bacterium]